MAHLIDKSALVAEINNRIEKLWDSLPNASDVIKDNYTKEEANATGKYTALESFRDYINTLEVKEVQEEPISEDLEETIKTIKLLTSNTALLTFEYGFRKGAKWQKANLWKPADGDDLPGIDREVIALLDNGKVVFAHRPPEYWDGKDIITGKVTRNYPKTYGKGGWNQPHVLYWLDARLPYEENKIEKEIEL